MPSPRVGPCLPWLESSDLACLNEDGELPGSCVDGAPVDSDQIDRAIDSASYVLWALSGRQFGQCETVIRPCRRDCLPGTGSWASWDGLSDFVTPVLLGGQWMNLTCGCSNGCGCTELCEVRLPAPVAAVVEVKVDGDVLDEDAYRVDNWRTLVRLDGGCWPLCQDMEKADTEVGTWSVDLLTGVEVPGAGVTAAAQLACELLKAEVGAACQLPQRVQSLARQGVSATFFDPMEFLDEGRTGLFFVDLFLLASNPAKLQSRPTVWSPDFSRHRTAGT